MFWQEEKQGSTYRVPDDIVDLGFRIDCKCLPLEHAYALSRALHEALPWLADEERAGVHLIHGAESGNGWMRPEDARSELLYLSRRTRMTLRLPKERLDQARALTGRTLNIEGYVLTVGEGVVKSLSTSSTIFSRYVANDYGADEQAFVQAVAREIGSHGVAVRKLVCGKDHVLHTPDGDIATRSVMLADLKPQESVTLQQRGVGPHRQLGCGLFIAHKGIAPVAVTEDQ